MRTIKMLLTGLVAGMVGATGGLIVLKAYEAISNPDNQAKVKRVFKNIKDEFAQ